MSTQTYPKHFVRVVDQLLHERNIQPWQLTAVFNSAANGHGGHGHGGHGHMVREEMDAILTGRSMVCPFFFLGLAKALDVEEEYPALAHLYLVGEWPDDKVMTSYPTLGRLQKLLT